MSEMIEHVARALCRHTWKRHFKGRDLDAYEEIHWRDHKPGALVAIKAMREPDLEMLDAGNRAAREIERLRAALRAFTVHATYPVSTEINPRGYAWRGEEALDYAMSLANAAGQGALK